MPFHLFLLLTLLLNTALAADTPSAASGSEPALANAPSGAESSAPADGEESGAAGDPSSAPASEGTPASAADSETSAASATGDADQASTPVTPGQSDEQLLRDWHTQPFSKTIGKEQVLYAEHTSGQYLGLAILLPEWQGTSKLWPLSASLTAQGFDTLLLLPRQDQHLINPAEEKKNPAREAFRADLRDRIKAASEAKLKEGGFRLLLVQGSAANWIASQLTSENSLADAAVLLDAGFAEQGANQVLAREIAQSPLPVLDLAIDQSNGWLTQATDLRNIAGQRSHKLNYRSSELVSTDEIPATLLGWLHHLGWL